MSYDGFIGGRTFDEVFAVGLIRGERVDRKDEPPRGSVDADVAVFKIKFFKQGRNPLSQLFISDVHIVGGEFFYSDFQNKCRRSKVGEQMERVQRSFLTESVPRSI